MQVLSAVKGIITSLSYKLPTFNPDEQKICFAVRQMLQEIAPNLNEGEVYDHLSYTLSSHFWSVEIPVDFRHPIIHKIAQKTSSLEETELANLSVKKGIDLYLRLEHFFTKELFIDLSTKSRTLLWEKVQNVVSTQGYFQSVPQPSEDVSRNNTFLKLLSIHSELQEKFGSFYQALKGLEEVKTSLFFEAICPLLIKEESLQEGIILPNSILLYGPPGCGKKSIVRLLAITLNCPLIRYNLQTKIPLEEIFIAAKTMEKSVILIEDASFIFPDPSEIGSAGKCSEELDLFFQNSASLIDEAKDSGILVILSTNYPKKIHPSILQKIDIQKRFYIAPPDERERAELFKTVLGKSTNSLERLISQTALCSRYDIRKLFTRATSRMDTLKPIISRVKLVDCLEKELSEFRPSLSDKILEEFETARESFALPVQDLLLSDIDISYY